MKKNRPKTIPFSKVVDDFYKGRPEERAAFEQRVEELRVLFDLREARQKAKITQVQLAQKSGVNQDKISRIESGKYNPTIQTLQKIAAGMGKKIKIELV